MSYHSDEHITLDKRTLAFLSHAINAFADGGTMSMEDHLSQNEVGERQLSEEELQTAKESLRRRLGFQTSRNRQDLSLEALLSRVSHPEWEERVAAIRVFANLGELMPPGAVHALCDALNDTVSSVRAAAAQALGRLEQHAPRQALLLTLRDRDDLVRASAIQALGRLGPDAPVETLISAFHDEEDASVRLAALCALTNLQVPMLFSLLLNALNDSDACVRAEALQTLGTLKPELPFDMFLTHLQDPEELVRLQVLDILMTRQERLPTPLIEHLLTDPSEDVRLAALRLLAYYKERLPIMQLLLCLKDSSEAVRREASHLLGSAMQHITEQVDTPFLLALLQEDDEQLKALAAWTLGEKRERRAWSSLQAVLHDKSEIVRQAARWALERCTSAQEIHYNWIEKRSRSAKTAAPQSVNDINTLLYAFIEYLHDKKGYVQPERYSNAGETILVFLCCFQNEGQSLQESLRQQLDDRPAIENLPSALQSDDDVIQWVMKQTMQKFRTRKWSEVLVASAMIPSANAAALSPDRTAQKIILCSISCQQVRESDPPVLDQLRTALQEHSLCTAALQGPGTAYSQAHETEQTHYDPYTYMNAKKRTRITEPLGNRHKCALDTCQLWYEEVSEASSNLEASL